MMVSYFCRGTRCPTIMSGKSPGADPRHWQKHQHKDWYYVHFLGVGLSHIPICIPVIAERKSLKYIVSPDGMIYAP